ncbi:MAG: hypothetical protein ACREVC_17840, partial [Burkholderiales bacterium]
ILAYWRALVVLYKLQMVGDVFPQDWGVLLKAPVPLVALSMALHYLLFPFLYRIGNSRDEQNPANLAGVPSGMWLEFGVARSPVT